MLASFRCNLTLKEVGTVLPSFVDDLRAGNDFSNSVHKCFMSDEEVRESASSTAVRNIARNRRRHSKASLISGATWSELESNTVVSSRSFKRESCSRPSRRLRLKVWVTKSSSYH